MSEENLKHHLEVFLRDIDILDDLNRWNKQINFFEITGIIHQEIKHSNFLAWLLDANESHGLGDGFVRRFIHQTFFDNGISLLDIAMIEYDTFEVRREWQHIDLLLVSKDEKVVFAIENKVYSTESKGQLNKYRQLIESQFSEYKRYYIYLTLDGDEPSEPDHWMIATYSSIEQRLKDLLLVSGSIGNDTRQIIENYISMLRRNLIMDRELQDLCWKIYRKHKVALKTIFDVTQDNRSILSAEIKSLLETNQKSYGIVYNPSHSSTTIIRFTTPYIEEYLPKHDTGYGWKNGYRFMYEFQIRKSGLFLIGVLSEQNDPNCQKLKEFAKINSKKYNLRVNANSSIWTIVFKVSYILKAAELEEGYDEYSEIISGRIENVLTKDLVNFEKGFQDYIK
jgi:hypothetical protein